MSLVVPTVAEVLALEFFLERNLTLKLFANNVVPAESDTESTYTEVTGGGYASQTLSALGWTITGGDPSFGIQSQLEFTFSGATGGSGNIYGYYVVDDDDVLCWAERFPEASVPFTPTADAMIRITPRFEAS